jgi:hypothetical protein
MDPLLSTNKSTFSRYLARFCKRQRHRSGLSIRKAAPITTFDYRVARTRHPEAIVLDSAVQVAAVAVLLKQGSDFSK